MAPGCILIVQSGVVIASYQDMAGNSPVKGASVLRCIMRGPRTQRFKHKSYKWYQWLSGYCWQAQLAGNRQKAHLASGILWRPVKILCLHLREKKSERGKGRSHAGGEVRTPPLFSPSETKCSSLVTVRYTQCTGRFRLDF